MRQQNMSTVPFLDRRMRRLRFVTLLPLAFGLPLVMAAAILHINGFATSEIQWGLPLGMAVFSVTILAQLVATGILVVLRANDCGKDRGLVAFLLLPGVNIALLIYLMFPASTDSNNKVTSPAGWKES